MKISDLISNLSTIKIYEFQNTTNAFNFVFRKDLEENEAIIIRMPPVSANKRGINDIGWISDAEVGIDKNGNPDPKIRLYGTLTPNLRDGESLVQEIRVNDEVNKTTSAIIVKNLGKACRIEMRAIFN
jgi:hypothetical protein